MTHRLITGLALSIVLAAAIFALSVIHSNLGHDVKRGIIALYTFMGHE